LWERRIFSFNKAVEVWRSIMHGYRMNSQDDQVPMGLGLETHACWVPIHSPEELCSIFAKLEAWMRILGYPRKDIFAVLLSVSEAAGNAVRHGNRGDRYVPRFPGAALRRTDAALDVVPVDPDVRGRPGGPAAGGKIRR
jgi:hypothetical protein